MRCREGGYDRRLPSVSYVNKGEIYNEMTNSYQATAMGLHQHIPMFITTKGIVDSVSQHAYNH